MIFFLKYYKVRHSKTAVFFFGLTTHLSLNSNVRYRGNFSKLNNTDIKKNIIKRLKDKSELEEVGHNSCIFIIHD